MHLLTLLDLCTDRNERFPFPCTSASKIPTLPCTWSLKKVLHSDGAFPYSSPPPHPPVQLFPYHWKITKRKQRRFFLDRRYKQAVGFWYFHFSNSEDCKDCGDYVRYVFSFVPGILAAICVLTVLLLQVSLTVKNQNGECQVSLQE